MNTRKQRSEYPDMYDLLSGEVIKFEKGKIKSFFDNIGMSYTGYSHMVSGKLNHIYHRFILEKNRNKIFILVDVDSGERYECFTNKTIFMHLSLPYSDNEAKYVYELRAHRQVFASICGRVFKLDGGKKFNKVKKLKNQSNYISGIHANKKVRYKVKIRLHSRLLAALRAQGVKKKTNFNHLVGCTNKDLFEYIESKFTNGMNWENRTLWEIDHIKPCSRFNLLDHKEQIRCFHYTNLQPIWKNSETAKKMGESDLYIGNHNKTDNEDSIYDYMAVAKIKHITGEKEAIEICKHIFSKGFRKVILKPKPKQLALFS